MVQTDEVEEHVLYVGGLSFDTKEDGLLEWLNEQGIDATSVRILTRPDGKSHGYACILKCALCRVCCLNERRHYEVSLLCTRDTTYLHACVCMCVS